MSKQSELLAKLQEERLQNNTKTTAPKPEAVEEKPVPSPERKVAKPPKKKAVKETETPVTKSMTFRRVDLECIDRITMGLIPRGVRANASLIMRAAIHSVNLDEPERAEAFTELVKQLQSEDGRRKPEA